MSSEALEQLLVTMPKAELHLHIEGTLEPELIFQLAQRNNMELPYASVERLREAYEFQDLQSFLDLYYAGCAVLHTQQDFFDLAWAYFLRAQRDHIVRAEIFFDPQTHTARGVSFETVITGLYKACQQAQQELNISSGLIMCFLRHLSEEEAFETLGQASYFKDYLIGVGLNSSEVGNSPKKFANVFAKCRSIGLRVVAHAGEEGPAEYVTEALDMLQSERIDHGFRAVEDPVLMERLKAERIPLTVCPLSNIKLKCFKNLEDHNLVQLLKFGLAVTINSDDPAYFGGYLNDNFLQFFKAHPEIGLLEAYQLARNSLEAAFCGKEEKCCWISMLDDCFHELSAKSK